MTIRLPRHPDGMIDKRYTAGKEWAGYHAKVFVIRFCGDYIDCTENESDAQSILNDYHKKRQNELTLSYRKEG